MKARLLIVDDEAEICDMLSRHFRYLGYAVDTASNGIEAMEKLVHVSTQVVISDIVMPRVDGVELLRAVQQQYPMVHTIMITGYVTLENALSCMRHGADTCIFKPLEDLSELEEAVERAVISLKRWQDKLKELQRMKPAVSGDCYGK
ncbi:MAG TPA: response regulator [Phycisphaerales bacterium]|nr:response regulator [Phycisphaerales bacterium]